LHTWGGESNGWLFIDSDLTTTHKQPSPFHHTFLCFAYFSWWIQLIRFDIYRLPHLTWMPIYQQPNTGGTKTNCKTTQIHLPRRRPPSAPRCNSQHVLHSVLWCRFLVFIRMCCAMYISSRGSRMAECDAPLVNSLMSLSVTHLWFSFCHRMWPDLLRFAEPPHMQTICADGW